MVLLGDDLVAVEFLGPLEVGLGHRELGLRLEIAGVRLAHIEAVEHGQRLSGLHLIAEIDVYLDDAPRHPRCDMGDAVLVGTDGGGHDQLLADFLRHEFFDLDPGGFDRLGAELELLLIVVPGFVLILMLAGFFGDGVLLHGSVRFGRLALATAGKGEHRQNEGRQGSPGNHGGVLHECGSVVRVVGKERSGTFHFSFRQPAACSSSMRVRAKSVAASSTSRRVSSTWRVANRSCVRPISPAR